MRQFFTIVLATLMIIIALAFCAAVVTADEYGSWCWDPVEHPYLDGYRVYWSHVADGWAECDRAEVPWNETCIDADLVEPPGADMASGEVIFFLVTAFSNDPRYSESPTGR
jgi:hypothetical protein